jgi:hypothetical protein
MNEHIDPRVTHLHTDAAMGFRRIGREYQEHSWVDHKLGEYVRGDVSTNQAENYFSQLKRSLEDKASEDDADEDDADAPKGEA